MSRNQTHYGLFDPTKDPADPISRDWFEPDRVKRMNQLLREMGSPMRWKPCRARVVDMVGRQAKESPLE